MTNGRTVAAIVSSPAEASAVVTLDVEGTAVQASDVRRTAFEIVKRSQESFLEPGSVSVPRAIDFPTGDGETAHLLLYEPANAEFSAPAGDRPPVIVVIHGGPTGQALPVFDRGLQFWTTRGFAVADVNYRGSAGFGRDYRGGLAGRWGIADVEDCSRAIQSLDAEGLVDGARALIRGGSAGGFTTLAALAFTDTFAAGASLYGVADLELLARDTHKFESRYLDTLVGPLPEAEEEYKRRSPIHHVEMIASPLILFQGSDDKVVPPSQSRSMFEALRERGVPVEYHEFEGEQHGFRLAETVMAVAAAELEFYQRVLGL